MKQLRKIICALLLGLPSTVVLAQETISASGAEGTSISGSVSYTVGQIACSTFSIDKESVIQGVQQPYEIITLIENPTANNLQLIIYPNPTSRSVKLVYESFENQDVRYMLYDINSILLQNKKVNSRETEILMANYPASVYILKVFINQKEVKGFKIIKK